MLNLHALLDAVDLVQLIEHAGGAPKQRGQGYACACPIHNGDDPNFSIFEGDDGRWRWHCFSRCQAGGDAIDFVIRWKNLDFIEAAKWLAIEWARLPLEDIGWTEEAIKEHKKQISISDLLTRAVDFYYQQIWHSPAIASGDALEFACSRGFTDDHLRAIKWGYSDSSNKLLDFLAGHDETAPMIPLAREIGLIRADGKDFTANQGGDEISPAGWLIYPHWHNRKAVYLSARAVSPIEKGSKSRNLPGPRQVYRAGESIDGKPFSNRDLIIVEGPADAETIRAWGYPAIALCGVSLTQHSPNGRTAPEENPLLSELRRIARRRVIYLGLSNDAAGKIAEKNLAPLIGPLTRIVHWPKAPDQKKSDANDLLKEGKTAFDFSNLLEDAKPFLDIEITRISRIDHIREKAEGVAELAGLVAQLAELERKMYTRTIAGDKGLNISVRDFEKMVRDRMDGQPPSGIEVRNNQFHYWGEPLTNFTCQIDHELSRDDGLNPADILYTISGKLVTGEPLPAIEIGANDFDSLNWIGPSWGARPIIYIGGGRMHVLRRAIKERSMETEMTRRKVFTFTGWHRSGGERFFLSASGALSGRGLDASIQVDLDNNLSHYNLPPPTYGGELVEAVQASLQFLDMADLSITGPIWAAMYAAPLTPFKSLNAVVWIYGPTQSKKSSIAHLALTHFGQGFVGGRDYKSAKDWTSSAADLEATMFQCKDVPFVIDDYAPQFTDAGGARKQAKTAHYVVRSVGNRSSRGRRRADMTAQKQFIPRGLVLATAEQPLIGQSIVGRMIFVEIEIGSVDLERLSAGQEHHHLYSQAMSAYLLHLAGNWERLETELPDRFAAAQAAVSFPGQDRLADYYAVLKVASDLMFEWAVSIGAISQADADEKRDEMDMALVTLLASQSTRISQQAPVLRFFEALNDLIATGTAVLPLRTNKDYIVPQGATLVGWQDPAEKRLLLMTGPALGLVKQYWNNLDERYDTLIDALRREMHQYGFLAKKAIRQYEINVWIHSEWNQPHGTQRVLVIDAEKVHEEFDFNFLSANSQSDRKEPEGDGNSL